MNSENGMKRGFFGLTFKFAFALGVTGICIVTAAIAVGVQTYRESIASRYNEFAYQAARVAEDYFTAEEIAQYADLTYRYHTGAAAQEEIDAVLQSLRYREIKRQLDHLRASIQANDIFVFVFDMELLRNFDPEGYADGTWNPLCYIADSYRFPERQLRLGDCGSIFEEYVEASIKAYETGVHPDNYFISEGKFGYNTSAIYPVVQEGRTIAFIGVEIPMATLENDVRGYVAKVVIAGAVVTVVLLILLLMFLVRTLIWPVKMVAEAASQFVSNNNMISDALEKIHTRDEIELLSKNVLKMEHDINNYIADIMQVTAEKERIGAELRIAAQIQADMLPGIFPAFPGRPEIDIYAMMEPAKEVGGDFYDFFMVDERHLAMVIADVSGKGVPAALFMVIGKTLIKDHTVPGVSLGKVFMEVNELLCESNKEGLFITAFECVLDLVTGELIFVNAGHELPFIRKKNGSYESYKTRPGFVLAGMEGVRYRMGTLALEEGDRLFLYTDGVPEATDSEDRLYGIKRLEKALNVHKDKAPKELLPAIRQDIDRFVGEAVQFDDITMLSMEFCRKMETEIRDGGE